MPVAAIDIADGKVNLAGNSDQHSTSPTWASIELSVAVAINAAGLKGYIPYSSVPWLLVAATVSLWWRGPGWRNVGLRKPSHVARTITIGIAVGVGYQFLGLYLIEPLIARATSAPPPDVAAFRSLVGNGASLAFWLIMSWSLAAFAEEMVYRGWLMTRVAELGRFSAIAWIAAVAGTSALFGLIHLYQGVSGVIANGLSGVTFAIVYFATGRNLWAAILAHGFMDTTGFVMIYFGIYPGL